jgi:hypothetical protein
LKELRNRAGDARNATVFSYLEPAEYRRDHPIKLSGTDLNHAAGPRLGAIPYICVILVAALCTYAYTLRTRSAFACPASGYDADRYLAYCSATEYGDFDHGAFWFDLIPGIRENLERADALFVGNSRMQFGFSAEPTRRWFAGIGATHYLVGFAYWENVNFEIPLLKKFTPRPKVAIVNVDSYFVPDQTEPAKAVMHDPAALGNYRRKEFWQIPHRFICGELPAFCGNNGAFFRSISTGYYLRLGGNPGAFPVSEDPKIDSASLEYSVGAAERLMRALPVERSCVLFTIVPTDATKRVQAEALAHRLDVKFISPQIQGLTTFDRSHLDLDSATRWSAAFFEQAAPEISRCLSAAHTG